MKTKLTKNLAFLQPFLVGLEKLVPVEKLYAIQGYRVPKGLTERTNASIIRHSPKKYTINLRVETLVNKGKDYLPPTLEQTLLDLAHELAHLEEWEHTWRHFHIQSQIMLHFAEVLYNMKILDHSKRINEFNKK